METVNLENQNQAVDSAVVEAKAKTFLNASVSPEEFDWDTFERGDNYGDKAAIDAAYEQTLSKVVENEVAEGEVVAVTKREVVVTVGGKSEGVIAAKRHIHMIPETAEKLGLKNKDVVWVKMDTDGRQAVLGDVVVRVSETFADAMHIDTDESNAAGCAGTVYGEILA